MNTVYVLASIAVLYVVVYYFAWRALKNTEKTTDGDAEQGNKASTRGNNSDWTGPRTTKGSLD